MKTGTTNQQTFIFDDDVGKESIPSRLILKLSENSALEIINQIKKELKIMVTHESQIEITINGRLLVTDEYDEDK